MRLRHIFPLVAVLLLTTFATAQKVYTDFDRSANFTGYHTYAWGEGTSSKNQLMDQRIRENIDQQLTAKGLKKVDDPASADLLVAYDAAVGQTTQLNTTGMDSWGGVGWGRMGMGPGMGGMTTSTTTVTKIPTGELAVSLGDTKTHRIVWRGAASSTLSDNPDKSTKTIQNAITKMFAKYPPKG
jgi:hypothetical protein